MGAALSIFEDVVIILLPVLELQSLPLSFGRKMAVTLLFALGSLYVYTIHHFFTQHLTLIPLIIPLV